MPIFYLDSRRQRRKGCFEILKLWKFNPFYAHNKNFENIKLNLFCSSLKNIPFSNRINFLNFTNVLLCILILNVFNLLETCFIGWVFYLGFYCSIKCKKVPLVQANSKNVYFYEQKFILCNFYGSFYYSCFKRGILIYFGLTWESSKYKTFHKSFQKTKKC